MSEQVLAVETAALAPYIAGRTGLIRGHGAAVLALVEAQGIFLPRPEAERDPRYKQIIPYVTLVRGGEAFLLRRLSRGGEKRLAGMLSLGVGGHINPSDGTGAAALKNGLRRELAEEVALEGAGTPVPRGLINDDTAEVGRVHLGIFFTLEVSGEARVLETEKLEGAWRSIAGLGPLVPEMETWSRFVLEAL